MCTVCMCVSAYVRACVRACVRVCVYVCACVYMYRPLAILLRRSAPVGGGEVRWARHRQLLLTRHYLNTLVVLDGGCLEGGGEGGGREGGGGRISTNGCQGALL